jgi:transposase
LTGKLEQLVVVWDTVQIGEYVQCSPGSWTGRPELDRRKMARAYIVEAVYNHPTTEAMIEHLRSHRALRLLCGYDSIRAIPSSATLSRAFREFLDAGLGDVVHKHLVEKYIGDQIVMHESQDSMAVVARERTACLSPSAILCSY